MKKLTIQQGRDINGEFALLKNNTKDVYILAIDQFYDYFEIDVFDLRQINRKHILNYLNHLLDKNYTANTINLKMDAVKFLFNAAQNTISDFKSPFAKLKDYRIKSQQGNKQILSAAQADRLLIYLQRHYNNKIYILCKTILRTGLRITEALSLQRRNFIDKGMSKSFFRFFGKGKKERMVPLSKVIYSDIKEYLINYDISGLNDCIFEYSRIYISKVISTCCKELFGLSGIGTHALRHTFATLYYRRYPEKLGQLSDMLGHYSPSYTRATYINLAFPLEAEEVDSLYS